MKTVKITFSNDDTITTNMNPKLTDKEIKDYYKIGRIFNIGNVEDNLQKVIKVEILKK